MKKGKWLSVLLMALMVGQGAFAAQEDLTAGEEESASDQALSKADADVNGDKTEGFLIGALVVGVVGLIKKNEMERRHDHFSRTEVVVVDNYDYVTLEAPYSCRRYSDDFCRVRKDYYENYWGDVQVTRYIECETRFGNRYSCSYDNWRHHPRWRTRSSDTHISVEIDN